MSVSCWLVEAPLILPRSSYVLSRLDARIHATFHPLQNYEYVVIMRKKKSGCALVRANSLVESRQPMVLGSIEGELRM